MHDFVTWNHTILKFEFWGKWKIRWNFHIRKERKKERKKEKRRENMNIGEPLFCVLSPRQKHTLESIFKIGKFIKFMQLLLICLHGKQKRNKTKHCNKIWKTQLITVHKFLAVEWTRVILCTTCWSNLMELSAYKSRRKHDRC